MKLEMIKIDETRVTVVPFRITNVLCLEGQKQDVGINSTERGSSIVALVFMRVVLDGICHRYLPFHD